MNLQIEVSNEINEEVESYLIKQFRAHKFQVGSAYFEEDGSPRDAQDLQLIIRDETDELIAGLTGTSYFGALHINWLWVHEAYRKKGYARELLRQAFLIAQERDCQFAWLDTWDVQEAYKAYEKLGAKLMTRIPFPKGSSLSYFRFDFEELIWLKKS